MDSLFSIPDDATSIEISITPDQGYYVDSESGIEINGEKTRVSNNVISYSGLNGLSDAEIGTSNGNAYHYSVELPSIQIRFTNIKDGFTATAPDQEHHIRQVDAI